MSPPRRSRQLENCVFKRYSAWHVHRTRLDQAIWRRRLYNTVEAAYASLEDLEHMVLRHVRFVVRDSETGADITRDVLDQLR